MRMQQIDPRQDSAKYAVNTGKLQVGPDQSRKERANQDLQSTTVQPKHSAQSCRNWISRETSLHLPSNANTK